MKCRFHNPRIWFTEKPNWGLCARCGRFITTHPIKKYLLWWMYVRSFLSRQCLSCIIIWANEKRRMIIRGDVLHTEPHRQIEGTVLSTLSPLDTKANPEAFREMAMWEIINLKYNHNWKCWLKIK